MFDRKRKKRTLPFPIFYALVIPTDLRKRPSNINKDRISLSPLHELVTSFFWFGLKTYDSLLYNNNHFQFFCPNHYQCFNGQLNCFSSKYFREKINYELMQRTFFMTVLSVIHVFFSFILKKQFFHSNFSLSPAACFWQHHYWKFTDTIKSIRRKTSTKHVFALKSCARKTILRAVKKCLFPSSF